MYYLMYCYEQLTVDSGDETGVGYHVLNTSYTPREATCWLAWLDRWPDGGTYQTFPLEDEHGTELDMEYLMYCEAGRGGLNGSPRDDHVSEGKGLKNVHRS